MMRVRATGKEGTNQGERGFTLIEVMFASVYLAIGLLAIAAMQDTAISRNTDARRMNYATNLAAEMLERIRYNSPANSTPIVGGTFVYDGIRACSDVASAFCGAESPGNAIAANNLTASGDYDQWRARLKATNFDGTLLLPNAVATVTSAQPAPLVALQQVEITVMITYFAGIRNPRVEMHTFVAPL